MTETGIDAKRKVAKVTQIAGQGIKTLMRDIKTQNDEYKKQTTSKPVVEVTSVSEGAGISKNQIQAMITKHCQKFALKSDLDILDSL